MVHRIFRFTGDTAYPCKLINCEIAFEAAIKGGMSMPFKRTECICVM